MNIRFCIVSGALLLYVGHFGLPGASSVREIWYWTAYFGLDSKYAGVGAGMVYSSAHLPGTEIDETIPVSGHLRLGPRSAHSKLSIMEGQPIASGGGCIQMGVGFAPRPQDAFFIGLSAEPYDGAGFAGSMDLSINEQISLLARTRVGTTEGQFEGGLALGLRWNAIH